MIHKAAIYTCDICKTKEILSTEGGKSGGWADFFLAEVGEWRQRNIFPSQRCPTCARTIKLTVEAMMNEKGREG